MNKDVIYIEPEDDITDIINKVEKSKRKIVALVPPKKAGILRSIVNIKLIAKTAANTGKSVVLVTIDPSITKLAAATKLPVTKDLQSAPSIPKIEPEKEVVAKEEVVETVSEDGEEKIVAKEEVEESDTEDEAEENDTKDEVEEKSEDKSKSKKKEKSTSKKLSDNPLIKWMQLHKKLCIIGSVALFLLILIMIWAFAIAPAATVTIGIRTTKNNFSENVTFTEKLDEENANEGKFHLEQKKLEAKSETEFEATGEKNVGEKAKGSVIIYAYFKNDETVTAPAGTIFTNSGLNFTSTADATLSWKKGEPCENTDPASLVIYGCRISKEVSVVATEPGVKYNIGIKEEGWKTASFGVYANTAIDGGTDKIIKIVTQADVDKAISALESSDLSTEKEKLLDQLSDTSFAIEPSFKQTVGEAVSTPKVGEEVKEGEKAKLSVTTTYSIYFIDKTKVEEFIKEKAKLAENFKVYSINDPFIENFVKTDAGYTGKLKTSYTSGPKVTENDVVEIIKGKGLGTAQHDLKDIDGVSSIKIDTSYPWVMSIPSDPNKIIVILNVEE